jgi:indolepyruvate ferredoxin oxidoreductase alpha subunit
MSAVISELMKKEGVKVLVSRQLCRLIFMRNARKNKLKVPVYWIDPKKCKKCGVCVQYGCPAIHVDKPKRYYIDPDFCWGCTVCSQVCPYNAISVRMEPEKKEVKK